MAKFIITGGKPLTGTISAQGNKNAALPMLAATLLTTEDCFLDNVPQIGDVKVMCQILTDLGAEIEDLGNSKLRVNTKNVNSYVLDTDLVSKLRASVLLLGPLVARFKKAKIRHPGGDIIGKRAVGTHFDALAALGAETSASEVHYESAVSACHPCTIFLDEASVTATENVLMFASLIPGETIVEDAACEPHVVDLANFLNAMGAQITGAGTNRISIKGVTKLHGATGQVGPDFMDIASFAVMAAVTKGQLVIKGVKSADLSMILLYFQRFGLKFDLTDNQLTLYPSHLVCPKGKLQTRPWPGFPTDIMSPFIVLASQSQGITLCHDWMYESRMFFVDKLIAMGAEITLCDPHRVLVCGPSILKGKVVDSPDIRAGMAMICAALCAQGQTVINNVEMIERGYENIVERLQSLGADINRQP